MNIGVVPAYENKNVVLYHADCRDILPLIPDGSIDSVVSDPIYPCIDRPYGKIDENEWMCLMKSVVKETRRILKPKGSAVFILQPNSERIGKMRLWLWEFLVWVGKEWGVVQDFYWENTKPMPTLHCNRKYGLARPAVKYCVWVGDPDCYRSQDDVLVEPSYSTKNDKRKNDGSLKYSPSSHHVRHSKSIGVCIERGGATPVNSLKFAAGGTKGHSAETPYELADWWIRYITPSGGVILDPFCGGGTMGEVAITRNLCFIGIEKNLDCSILSKNRFEELTLNVKAS